MATPEEIKTAIDGLSWDEIAPSFIKYGYQAYQKAPLIHRLWRQFQLSTEKTVSMMEPKTNIAIVGPENAGKSVLNDALQMRVREHSYSGGDASYDAERDLITIGKWSNVVSVVPGQGVKQKDVWLRKVFGSDSKLNGVIFVASWGFRVPRSKDVQKQLLSQDLSLHDLRKRMLRAEVNEFRDVCVKIREYYQETQRNLWVIVAVAKADLYFEDLPEVEKFYSFDGEPSSETVFPDITRFKSVYMSEIAERIGADHVPAVSLPVSSFLENFDWGDSSVAGAIVDKDRSALLNHLIATMNALSP